MVRDLDREDRGDGEDREAQGEDTADGHEQRGAARVEDRPQPHVVPADPGQALGVRRRPGPRPPPGGAPPRRARRRRGSRGHGRRPRPDGDAAPRTAVLLTADAAPGQTGWTSRPVGSAVTLAAVVRSELADGVADRIRDAILAGEYAPGDALPSERELSRQLGANRTTVREGLAQLEHQGLVERRQGTRGRVLDYRRTGSIELLPDLIRLAPRRPARRAVAARVHQRGVANHLRRRARPRVRACRRGRVAEIDALASDVEQAAAARDRYAVARANRAFHQGVGAPRTRSRSSSSWGASTASSTRPRRAPSPPTSAVAHALIELHARASCFRTARWPTRSRRVIETARGRWSERCWERWRSERERAGYPGS